MRILNITSTTKVFFGCVIFSSQESVLYALTCNIERLFTIHFGGHQPRALAAGDGYAPPLRVSETPVLLLYEPAISGGRNYRHYHAHFRIYGLCFRYLWLRGRELHPRNWVYEAQWRTDTLPAIFAQYRGRTCIKGIQTLYPFTR